MMMMNAVSRPSRLLWNWSAWKWTLAPTRVYNKCVRKRKPIWKWLSRGFDRKMPNICPHCDVNWVVYRPPRTYVVTRVVSSSSNRVWIWGECTDVFYTWVDSYNGWVYPHCKTGQRFKLNLARCNIVSFFTSPPENGGNSPEIIINIIIILFIFSKEIVNRSCVLPKLRAS